MNPVITIILLSTLISPGKPVAGVLTVSGTTPACGSTAHLTATVLSPGGTVLGEYSKTFHFTMSEVSSGKVSGRFEVPLNATEPGNYILSVTATYCGVTRTERLSFKVCGVTLEKYTMTVSKDTVVFRVKFKNDCKRSHLVTLKAIIEQPTGRNNTVIQTGILFPGTEKTIPLVLNLTGLGGGVARVKVNYIYYGRSYPVDSILIPLPGERGGEQRVGGNKEMAVLIDVILVVSVVLLILRDD